MLSESASRELTFDCAIIVKSFFYHALSDQGPLITGFLYSVQLRISYKLGVVWFVHLSFDVRS